MLNTVVSRVGGRTKDRTKTRRPRLFTLLMTLKYIWRSFQPRLSFPRPFQQSLACFRVARSPSFDINNGFVYAKSWAYRSMGHYRHKITQCRWLHLHAVIGVELFSQHWKAVDPVHTHKQPSTSFWCNSKVQSRASDPSWLKLQRPPRCRRLTFRLIVSVAFARLSKRGRCRRCDDEVRQVF